MKSLLRQLGRRAAYLPGLMPLAVRVEDATSWHAAAGTPARLARLQAGLAACRTTDDWQALAQRFFPPTQIPSEIGGLLALAAAEGVRAVGEIGTAQGGTCFLLMHAIPGVRLALGLDLQIRHQSLLRRLAPAGLEFHAIVGSSYTPATVARTGRLLAGRQLDLLLIDGDHRYEGVRADYLAYRAHVRDGGLIAFHDIVSTGAEDPGQVDERWAGGVPRFWSEVRPTAAESWEFVADRAQRGFGLGVLRHRATA